MAVKLRLRRQGRKGRPYYHIVAADSRAPRDGKFLEKVGSYNPTADPAEIEVDHAVALKWLHNGAQPTDTVKSILRYTGVNLKFTLQKQGKTEEEVDAIFNKWVSDKESSIEAKKERLSSEKASAEAARLEAERKVREAKAAAIAAKNKPEEEEAPAEEEATEEPAAEAEAPATEEGAES